MKPGGDNLCSDLYVKENRYYSKHFSSPETMKEPAVNHQAGWNVSGSKILDSIKLGQGPLCINREDWN